MEGLLMEVVHKGLAIGGFRVFGETTMVTW
jgi:hypothetical protein